MTAFECRFRRGRRRFQIGSTRAPDCFEAAGDVDASVELFGFEKAIVSCFEVVAFDVKACERETLAGGLFFLFR